MDPAKIDDDARQHLPGVTILPYERIFEDLTALKNEHKVRIGFGYSPWGSTAEAISVYQRVWVDPTKTNQALADCLSPETTLEDYSPISLLKSLKNEVELEGIRQSHLRDAAALVRDKPPMCYVASFDQRPDLLTLSRFPTSLGWRRL